MCKATKREIAASMGAGISMYFTFKNNITCLLAILTVLTTVPCCLLGLFASSLTPAKQTIMMAVEIPLNLQTDKEVIAAFDRRAKAARN
jgi:hypothetical protein